MMVYTAEDVGMSGERLRRINDYLDLEVAGDRLPGIFATAAWNQRSTSITSSTTSIGVKMVARRDPANNKPTAL